MMNNLNSCHIDWRTGGIVIGILSLIGSFPLSASGDVSVSCAFCCIFKRNESLKYGIFDLQCIFSLCLVAYFTEYIR